MSRAFTILFVMGCGGSPPNSPASDADNARDDGGAISARDSGVDGPGGTPVGVAMTCPGPGTPAHNGGSCGTERWSIKTGTDSGASSISLVPQSSTIAKLVALPAVIPTSGRESPTEDTVWELKDVTLTELKLESDSDYHLVISDGSKTMIAEIPYMSCSVSNAWTCFMSRSRSEIDAKYTVSTSPLYPSATITLRGVGFFDYPHGQTGVAPNAIELHPVLEVCFGHGCVPS
jgi:hypothetical protein